MGPRIQAQISVVSVAILGGRRGWALNKLLRITITQLALISAPRIWICCVPESGSGSGDEEYLIPHSASYIVPLTYAFFYLQPLSITCDNIGFL